MRISIIHQYCALALCLLIAGSGVQGRVLHNDMDRPQNEPPCACITLWAPVCDQETGKEYPNRQCAEACNGADPTNLKDGPCQPEPCACTHQWEPVCDKDGKQYSNRDCAINCEGASADHLGLCEVADDDTKTVEPPCPCQKSLKPVCDTSTGEKYDNEQCAVDCHGADPEKLEPCPELINHPGKHDDARDDMCVSRPISCTYDLNECGVSSSCTCLPGYEYNDRLGECLVGDLANLERRLPAAIPKTRGTDLQSTCAISVPMPCTADINICGHSGHCICPDGYAYDPRTALCMKLFE